MKKKLSKILLAMVLSFAIPYTINADEMPGARSATNEYGDVFLGGNYIEVGISKGGSFGTRSKAPESFKSHATEATNYRLGLLSDGDGWNVGEEPTTGDFFLPGSPEERLILSYKIGEKTYDNNQADRQDEYWNSPIQALEARDESDLEQGILKAVITGITKENIKVEITYSFKVNDNYYSTSVTITNLSEEDITDVRFTRSFDPDQDHDIYGEFDTYNKVICNPDPDQEGSSTNYAMVVARGAITYDGYFFIAFDNRARASSGVDFSPTSAYEEGLWEEKTEGLPTYATDEALAFSEEDTNGYVLDDTAIALTFNLNTLKKNINTTLNYFSSLSPDVINSKTEIIENESGKIKIISPSEPNSFGAEINNTNEQVASKIEITDSEEESMKNEGKNISIYLEVKDITDTISESDKEQFENNINKDTIGLYLDINLYKKVDGEEPTKITGTTTPIKITFTIPEQLLNTDTNMQRTFKIYRLHEGKITAINVEVNENIATFETDKFSNYALTYKDEEIKEETPVINNNPQTGDNIMFYISLLGLSLIGLVGASILTKKELFNK